MVHSMVELTCHFNYWISSQYYHAQILYRQIPYQSRISIIIFCHNTAYILLRMASGWRRWIMLSSRMLLSRQTVWLRPPDVLTQIQGLVFSLPSLTVSPVTVAVTASSQAQWAAPCERWCKCSEWTICCPAQPGPQPTSEIYNFLIIFSPTLKSPNSSPVIGKSGASPSSAMEIKMVNGKIYQWFT